MDPRCKFNSASAPTREKPGEASVESGFAFHTPHKSEAVCPGYATALLCFQREVPDGTPILVASSVLQDVYHRVLWHLLPDLVA